MYRMQEMQAHARRIVESLRAAGFAREDEEQRQVICLAEEAGEFMGAWRRWRGWARRKGTYEEMASELADVVITAFVTAEAIPEHVDLVAEINKKLEKIYSRGWREGKK